MPLKRRLRVEQDINKIEEEKDSEALGGIAQGLPSSSKIQVYKRGEDDAKVYIKTVPADAIKKGRVHEYVKNKFVKNYGGGKYLLEMVDSNDNFISGKEVDVAGMDEEFSPSSGSSHIRKMEEVLDLKEDAMNSINEAERAMRGVEKERYDIAIDNLNRQWSTISDFYEKQIHMYEKQLEGTNEPTLQRAIQDSIKDLESKLEQERQKLADERQSKEDQKDAMSKVFDLVANIIQPTLLSQQAKDPVTEFAKTVELVKNISGGNKDFLTSVLDEPQKLDMMRKMLGVEDRQNGSERRSFLEEIVENPEKAFAIRRALGISEEKKEKGFFESLFDNPGKIESFMAILATLGFKKEEPRPDLLATIIQNPQAAHSFRTAVGIPDQPQKTFVEELMGDPDRFHKYMGMFGYERPKDFFSVMFESEDKLNMFKRLMGVEDQPKVALPPPEPKKDGFDAVLEFADKLNAAKPILENMLGVKKEPVKDLMGLLGTIISNAGPHIANAASTIMNNMVALKVLEKSNLTNEQAQAILGGMSPQNPEAQPSLQDQHHQQHVPQHGQEQHVVYQQSSHGQGSRIPRRQRVNQGGYPQGNPQAQNQGYPGYETPGDIVEDGEDFTDNSQAVYEGAVDSRAWEEAPWQNEEDFIDETQVHEPPVQEHVASTPHSPQRKPRQQRSKPTAQGKRQRSITSPQPGRQRSRATRKSPEQGGEQELDIKQMFYNAAVEVQQSAGETIQAVEVVQQMSQKVLDEFQKNTLATTMAFMGIGGVEGAKAPMTAILKQVFGIEEELASQMSEAIIGTVSQVLASTGAESKS